MTNPIFNNQPTRGIKIMNAKTQKKPTGKVAEKITAAVKNIAKRLTAGKTAAVTKEPVKKAVAKKPKPASKPAKQKSTPKKTTTVKPTVSKPAKAAAKPAKPASQKSPVFCVHDNRVNQFVPVKGAKAISIPGFDGIQLFVHKGANDYRISEASSGGLVATGNTQKVAVQMATETLNKHGKPTVLESIQKSIERMGVVPGFVPPEGVKAPSAAKDAPKEVFKVTTDDGKEVEVTYTPGFMKHLEFRGEISCTGYHSSFDYAGKTNVKDAARKKANELRATFLKEQVQLERKAKKIAAGQTLSTKPAAPKAAKQPSASDNNRGGKSKGRMSLLDAAAEVLKESGSPLCCKDITRLIFEKKLAESGGLTPPATLSAAMGREISARGKGSRFKRADRGLFTVNS